MERTRPTQSNTTTISLRLSREVKQQAEDLFAGLGLNMSSALNLFLMQAIHCRGIPFDIRMPPNAETVAAMLEAERIAKDPNAKRYKNFSELLEDIGE